jgi:SAM-dependent methyltransferase
MREHLVRYRFAAGLAANQKVVDIGCGSGYGTALLAERARQVVGVDNALEAVAYARGSYQQPRLHFTVGDSRRLPLRDHSFSLAILFEVIEHIIEQEQCLSEIRRVLTAKGSLILSTPNPQSRSRAVEDANPFHAKELTEDQLQELLEPHFTHVQVLYQRELAVSGIQAAGGNVASVDLMEHFATAPDAKYFLALCRVRPVPASVGWTLAVGGNEHQIALVQDLQATQSDLAAHRKEIEELRREVEALLLQRETNEREYAANLAAHRATIEEHQREIEALLRQREANERTIKGLEEQNATRKMELEWLYRWLPMNRLARRFLYGKNLRRRLLTKLGFRT